MERGGKGGGRDRVGFEMIPNGSTWSRWIPWAYQSRWTVVGDRASGDRRLWDFITPSSEIDARDGKLSLH